MMGFGTRRAVLLGQAQRDPAAGAYFAAMTVAPPSARKSLINQFIVGLKADGVWPLLDALYLMAAHDAQAGLINLKNPAQIAVASGSPTFTTDLGYTGVPGTSGYIETNIADNAAGNWSQDSATLFVYINQAPTLTAQMLGLTTGSITRISGTAAAPVSKIHSSTTLTSTVANSLGFIAYAHTAAAANVLYRGSLADVTDATGSSTAPASGTFGLLRGGGTNSDARMAVGGWAGGMNGTQIAALNNRIATLLAAIGAA